MQVEQQSVQPMRAAYLTDKIARIVFLVCAVLLVAIIVAVFLFIGTNAFRVFGEGGSVRDFFLGTRWDPTGATQADANGNPIPSYGAGGLILGSFVVTFFSVLIATPLAIGMALFFTELCPAWLTKLLQPLIEVFTGMPSVVLGFLGLILVVPFLQRLVGPYAGFATAGFGWGAAILVLVIMILPTIISVSIDALRAVPVSMREASLALGSTRWQMMIKAIVPAATSALATGVILGLARAIGETLAVALVLGGSDLPKKLFTILVFFQPNVNITQEIANNFGEASGAARDAYWTLAFVLLVVSFLFVCISRYLASRSVYK